MSVNLPGPHDTGPPPWGASPDQQLLQAKFTQRAYRLMLWRPGFLFFAGGQGAHILPLLGVHFSEHTLLQGSVLSIPNHRLPSPGASTAEHSSPLQDLHPVRSHPSWWDRTLQPGPPAIVPGSPPRKTSLMVRWHSLALLKAQAPSNHPHSQARSVRPRGCPTCSSPPWSPPDR